MRSGLSAQDHRFGRHIRARASAGSGLAARGRSAETARSPLLSRLESISICYEQVFCHGLLAVGIHRQWISCHDLYLLLFYVICRILSSFIPETNSWEGELR